MRYWLFILAALAFVPAAAPAQSRDGHWLLEECSKDPSNPENGTSVVHCNGYVRGIFDLLYYSALSQGKEPIKCLPKGTTEQHVHDVILKYLKEIYLDRSLPAPMLIVRSLKDAFPNCIGT